MKKIKTGFSIIEILIALGLVAIIGAGIAATITAGVKQQRGIQAKDQQREITAEIRQLLNDKSACYNSFVGQNPTSSTGFTVANIKDALNVSRFTTLTNDKTNFLFFEEFRVLNFIPDAGYTTKGNADFLVKLTKVGDSGFKNIRSDTITIKVQLDSTNNIIDCFSIGSQSYGFWQATPSNLNNIFYAGGKVAIGTNAPSSALEIVISNPLTDIEDDLSLISFSNSTSPGFVGYRGRGTFSAPQPVKATDILSGIDGFGHNGTVMAYAGGITFNAETDFSSSINSYIVFNMVKSGVGSEKMRLTSNGFLGIGNGAPYGPLAVSPQQYVVGTASQSGTVITGTGTTFSSGMVSSQFVFTNGVSAGTITAVGSPTTLTVSISQTVANQSYVISYTGLNVDSIGRVGIGINNPGNSFTFVDSSSAGSYSAPFYLSGTYSPTVANGNDYWLDYARTNYNSNVNSYRIITGHYDSQIQSSGNLTVAEGLVGKVSTQSGATGYANTAYGVHGLIDLFGSGVFSEAAAFYAQVANSGIGSITTGYGIFIGGINALKKFGVYQADSTANNFFAGNVGIGTSAPNTTLEVKGSGINTYTDATRSAMLNADGGLELFRDNTSITSPNTNGYIDFKNVSTDDYSLRLSFDHTLGAAGGFKMETSTTGNSTGSAVRMVVDGGTGKVGIGTIAPSTNLHITSSAANGAGINLESNQSGGRSYGIYSTAAAASGGAGNLIIYNPTPIGGSATVPFLIQPDGNVGINTLTPVYRLDVQGGDINTSGSVRSTGVALTSDIRFKKDIQTLEISLEKILSLRGVKFNWRGSEFPERQFNDRHQIGVIAQEVEKVFPEVVDTNKDGFKSVNYPVLVAPLIEAIKELYGELKSNLNRLVQLEDKISFLQKITSEKDQKIEALQLQNKLIEKENADIKKRLDYIEKVGFSK